MAKKRKGPAKVVPLDLTTVGNNNHNNKDGFELDSSDSENEFDRGNKKIMDIKVSTTAITTTMGTTATNGKKQPVSLQDELDLLESGRTPKNDEPLLDAFGVPIVVDENGVPINPVVNDRQPTRFEKEIDFVMGNIDTRLQSLKLDEIFQKNKVVLGMITFGLTLIGFLLFLYGMNMSVIFAGTKQSVDFIAVGFAGVFWIPFFCFVSYLIYPFSKNERKNRRRLAWDRKDRRKSNLFNQLVDEARNATEPPPYKTRVIAHFRKKEYGLVAARWKEFCHMFYDLTGLPPERQMIRYNDVDLDIDLTKGLHEPPYNIKQNSHIYIYNRGGYFTQDTFVKRQYEEMMAERPKESPYEKPPDFNIEPPLNLKTIFGDGSRYSFRGGANKQNNQPNGRESLSRGGRESMSGGGGRDSMSAGGGGRSSLNSGGGGSARSSKEWANGRPITPVKAGAAAAKAKLGIGQKKPGSAGGAASTTSSGGKPPMAIANKPATTAASKPAPLPVSTAAHLPQITNGGGSVTGGGSVVSGGGSTVGGSVATGAGAMRGDRSLASTIS